MKNMLNKVSKEYWSFIKELVTYNNEKELLEYILFIFIHNCIRPKLLDRKKALKINPELEVIVLSRHCLRDSLSVEEIDKLLERLNNLPISI